MQQSVYTDTALRATRSDGSDEHERRTASPENNARDKMQVDTRPGSL